jgi:hypothetical protein
VIARLLTAALAASISLAATRVQAQEEAPRASSVRVELAPCAGECCLADWLEERALVRALTVELSGSFVSMDDASPRVLHIDRACAAESETLTLTLGDARRTVDLGDVPESLRVRALAIALRDLAVEVLVVHEVEVAEDAVAEVEAVEAEAVEDDASPPDDAPRSTPLPEAHPTGETPSGDAPLGESGRALSAPLRASASPPWLSLSIAGSAHLLGGRVPAPGLSIELAARISGTPVSLWVQAHGLYAYASDPLGEVHAGAGSGGLGASVTLEVSPLSVRLAAGVVLGYAATRGASGRADVRALGVEGMIFGIDVGATLAYQVEPGLRVQLALGALGYLVGFEARSEDRSVIPFRDIAPWLALGVSVDLGA